MPPTNPEPAHDPPGEQLRLPGEDSDTEGVFDAQLSLPLPEMPTPQPVAEIVKRDGRTEVFDKSKIAEAILSAARTVGGQDRDLAESLASAVAIYLAKRLQGATPTVDQVHDAVERVLIHMAHAKTALAYARYRDRRARIRHLREGDMRALLSEIDEANRVGGSGRHPRLLRTSGDAVTTWDRERIVAALVSETGLERAIAMVIAVEVEQQIEKANIRTLTTALVRELVGAKLVEHGLDDYQARHRRLGLPLHDTERIVRGTAASTVGESPRGTDQVLARAAKREYALAQVFSEPVADAHFVGEIHLHHLGEVDRLDSAELSLGDVVRHGIGLPGTESFAKPPQTAQDLLGQFLRVNTLLEDYFASGVAWDAVNFYFAPYLRGFGEAALADFSRMLVYEFSLRALSGTGTGQPPSVTLRWQAPPWLAGVEAHGEGGAPMEAPYGAYTHTAQQFACAVLDVLGANPADEASYPSPGLRIVLDPACLRSPGHEGFLERVAGLAAKRRPVEVLFEREAGVEEDEHRAWRAGPVGLQQITLNLPRAGMRAGKEPALLNELDRLLGVAMRALDDKRTFLMGLLARGADGPLHLLSANRAGRCFIDPSEARGLVALDGLRECTRLLLNAPAQGGAETAALAERIVAFVAQRCQEHGQRLGLTTVAAQNLDPEVSARFASLDLAAHPRTTATVLDTGAEDTHYTTGVRLQRQLGLTPAEDVRAESRLHALLEHGAVNTVALPGNITNAATVADFIGKVYRQTESRGIHFA